MDAQGDKEKEKEMGKGEPIAAHTDTKENREKLKK
jgi:hypothetical protein